MSAIIDKLRELVAGVRQLRARVSARVSEERAAARARADRKRGRVR
jgi:hypothetical protein